MARFYIKPHQVEVEKFLRQVSSSSCNYFMDDNHLDFSDNNLNFTQLKQLKERFGTDLISVYTCKFNDGLFTVEICGITKF